MTCLVSCPLSAIAKPQPGRASGPGLLANVKGDTFLAGHSCAREGAVGPARKEPGLSLFSWAGGRGVTGIPPSHVTDPSVTWGQSLLSALQPDGLSPNSRSLSPLQRSHGKLRDRRPRHHCHPSGWLVIPAAAAADIWSRRRAFAVCAD